MTACIVRCLVDREHIPAVYPDAEIRELQVTRAGVHLWLGDDGTTVTDAVDDMSSVIPKRGCCGELALDRAATPEEESK